MEKYERNLQKAAEKTAPKAALPAAPISTTKPPPAAPATTVKSVGNEQLQAITKAIGSVSLKVLGGHLWS